MALWGALSGRSGSPGGTTSHSEARCGPTVAPCDGAGRAARGAGERVALPEAMSEGWCVVMAPALYRTGGRLLHTPFRAAAFRAERGFPPAYADAGITRRRGVRCSA